MKLPTTEELLGKKKEQKPNKIQEYFEPTEEVRIRDFLRELPNAPKSIKNKIEDYFKPEPIDPTTLTQVRTRDIVRELPKAPSQIGEGVVKAIGDAVDPRYYFTEPEEGTQLVRPMFRKEPVEVKAPPLQRGAMSMSGMFAESVPLGLQTIGEGIGTLGGLLMGKKPKEQVDLSIGPFDPTLLGQTSSEYKTATGQMREKMKEGMSPWVAALEVGSTKTLDIAIAGLMIRDAARMMAPVLTKNNVVSKTEAWHILGEPKTLDQGKVNARRLLHKFHPDKPGGSNDTTKIINEAYKILTKQGIPTKGEIAQVEGTRWLDVLARQEQPVSKLFTKDFLRPDMAKPDKLVEPTTIKGLLEGTRPDPGLPVGMSTQKQTPTDKLTTRVLENVKGKTRVSKQFIEDQLKRPGVTGVEARLIRGVLDELPEGKVLVEEFMEKVKGQLVPLEHSDAIKKNYDTHDLDFNEVRSTKWENVQLPERKREDALVYVERIWESPIPTSAGDVHFRDSTNPIKGYWGHTRFNIMGDGYHPTNQLVEQILEMQSDLHQKDGVKIRLIRTSRDRTILVDPEEKPNRYDYYYLWETSIGKKDPSKFKVGQELHLYDGDTAMEDGWAVRKLKEFEKELKKTGVETAGETQLYEDISVDVADKLVSRLDNIIDEEIPFREMTLEMVENALNKVVEKTTPEGTEYFRKVYYEGVNDTGLIRVATNLEDLLKRLNDRAKLEPYRNTWWQRQFREELRDADLNNIPLIHFPTGRTALKIEGIISHDDDSIDLVKVKVKPKDEINITDTFSPTLPQAETEQLTPQNIEIGDIVKTQNNVLVVTDKPTGANEAGEFKAEFLSAAKNRVLNDLNKKETWGTNLIIQVEKEGKWIPVGQVKKPNPDSGQHWSAHYELRAIGGKKIPLEQGDKVHVQVPEGSNVWDYTTDTQAKPGEILEKYIYDIPHGSDGSLAYMTARPPKSLTWEDLRNWYKELKKSGSSLNESGETFYINPKKMKIKHPTGVFYDNAGKYLAKKFNAKIVKDKYGNEWWEINVPEESGKRPVEAFGLGAGLEIDEDGNVRIDPSSALMGVAGMGLAKRGLSKRPYEPNITTKVLDQLAGKQTVSAQFVRDLVKQPGVKEVEKNLIEETLEQHLRKDRGISEKLLIDEAKKYKTAEEFIKARTADKSEDAIVDSKDVLPWEGDPRESGTDHGLFIDKIKEKIYQNIETGLSETAGIDPLFVSRRMDGGYDVWNGHHRYQAMSEMGVEKIPVKFDKPGLRDIWNEAKSKSQVGEIQIKKDWGNIPIINEKVKTTSNGDVILYHGTDNAKLIKEEGYLNPAYASEGEEGVSVTPSKEYAREFGNEIVEVVVPRADFDRWMREADKTIKDIDQAIKDGWGAYKKNKPGLEEDVIVEKRAQYLELNINKQLPLNETKSQVESQVRVPEFIDEVRGQLVQLKVSHYSGGQASSLPFQHARYSNVTLPPVERGPVQKYFERVYRAPVETGGSPHDFPEIDYFMHTRIDDMTDGVTRRIMELQSDVFQNKGKLEKRIAELQSDVLNREKGVMELQSDLLKPERGVMELQSDVLKDVKTEEIKDIEKLMLYKNIWHERGIREEIRYASVSGKEKLQFPTGETAMKIEGITGEGVEITAQNAPIFQRYIEENRAGRAYHEIEGQRGGYFEIVNTPHGRMVVLTEPQDPGVEFLGIPEEAFLKGLEEYEIEGVVKYKIVPKEGDPDTRNIDSVWKPQEEPTHHKEHILLWEQFSDELFDASEVINVPGTGGEMTNHRVYKFYEKDIGKYLIKNYNAKKITDERGITWWEIDVDKEAGKRPIEAFGIGAGVEIDDDGEIYISPEKALFGFMAAGFARRKFSLSKRRESLADRFKVDKKFMEEALDAQRRGTIPFAQTVRNAEQITADIREVAKLKPGEILNAEQVESNWQVIRGTRTEYEKMKANLLADPLNQEIKNKADELAGLITKAIINTEAAGASEAGRVLAASQGKSEVEKISALAAQNINKVRKALTPAEEEMFDKTLLNLDIQDPEEVAKFLHMFSKSSLTDKIIEYYKSSLLSALTTQGFNFTSSLIMAELNIPIRATAGAFDALKSAVKGTPREVYVAEALRLQMGYMTNLRKATLEASRAMTREFYAGGPRSLLKEQKRPSPAIKGKTGSVIRTPFRIMHMIDTFERTIVVNSEIDAMAYRKATQEGFKGIEREERIAEIKLQPPTDIYETAVGKAERVLFFEDLRGMLQGINTLRYRMPVLGFVIPFFRSIINAGIVEAWRMTPGRFVTDPIVKARQGTDREITMGGAFSGKRDPLMENPLTRPEEIGRMIFGTTLAMSFFLAVLSNRLEVTGPAPTDKKERETFYGVGKKPYHFRIQIAEDKYTRWIEYRRLQPLGTMLFTMYKLNDMVELSKETEMTEDQMSDAVQNAITSTVRFVVTDQSAMQGVSQLLEALEGGKYSTGVWSAGNRYLQNFLGGFIPNLAFSGARSLDETIYFTDSATLLGFGDEFRKRIPFATKGLVPRRNIFGEVIGRGESALSRFLGPYRHAQPTNDPIFNELEKIEYGVALPQRTVYGKRLSLEEYDIYLQYAGKRLRSELERVMNTTGYQNADTMVKKEIVDNVASGVREEARVKLFLHYKKVYDLEKSLLSKGYSPKEAREQATSKYGIDEKQSTLQAEAVLNRMEGQIESSGLPTLDDLMR